jgi:hypothetical protein
MLMLLVKMSLEKDKQQKEPPRNPISTPAAITLG